MEGVRGSSSIWKNKNLGRFENLKNLHARDSAAVASRPEKYRGFSLYPMLAFIHVASPAIGLSGLAYAIRM